MQVSLRLAHDAVLVAQARLVLRWVLRRLRCALHTGDRNPELLAPPSDNLYAKNLPTTLTEDELRALFSPYGNVIECRVLHSGVGRDTAGVGAGALVRMASVEEAAQAINHLHNQRLQGSAMPLVVRYADSQEQKQKKAARQSRQYDRYAPGYMHAPMGPGGYHPHQHQQHSEHMGYYSPGTLHAGAGATQQQSSSVGGGGAAALGCRPAHSLIMNWCTAVTGTLKLRVLHAALHQLGRQQQQSARSSLLCGPAAHSG